MHEWLQSLIGIPLCSMQIDSRTIPRGAAHLFNSVELYFYDESASFRHVFILNRPLSRPDKAAEED